MASEQSTHLDELLVASANADRDAFAQLYDAVAGLVYGLVLAIIRDPALAEEVSQDAFVQVWSSAPRFDASRGGAKAWICTIAHRRAVDAVRREQSRRDREVRAATAAIDPDPTPDLRVVADSEREELRTALGSLTDLQREAVELAYFGGRTYREVAEMLGAPVGTVKTRIRDGLTRLGRALDG